MGGTERSNLIKAAKSTGDKGGASEHIVPWQGPAWAWMISRDNAASKSVQGQQRRTHTHALTQMHTQIHALPDTDTNTDTCSHLHAHADIGINTDMHTHREIHTFLHTQAYIHT